MLYLPTIKPYYWVTWSPCIGICCVFEIVVLFSGMCAPVADLILKSEEPGRLATRLPTHIPERFHIKGVSRHYILCLARQGHKFGVSSESGSGAHAARAPAELYVSLDLVYGIANARAIPVPNFLEGLKILIAG